jgi:hypothetical protein
LKTRLAQRDRLCRRIVKYSAFGGGAKAPGFDRLISTHFRGGNVTSGGRVGIDSLPTPRFASNRLTAIGLKVTANRLEGDNYKQPIVNSGTITTQGSSWTKRSVYATGSAPNQNLSIFARGNGSLLLNAETGGNVGIGTNPTRPFDVKSNNGIKLGLEGSGGGILIIGNNLNDNKVYVEAFNRPATVTPSSC